MGNSGKVAPKEPPRGLLSLPVQFVDEKAYRLADAMARGAARRRKQHQYSGELAALPTESDEARVRRYLLLFQHYRLKPWDWPALAVSLAATHVPGLHIREPAKKGRPRKVPPVQVTGLGLSGVPVSASFGPGLLGSHFVAKKKGGRPRNLSPEGQRMLLRIRDDWRANQDTGRITDSAFALHMCKQRHTNWKLLPRRERDKLHQQWKLEISRAKKSVSKP